MQGVVGRSYADTTGCFTSELACEWDRLCDLLRSPPWLRPAWTTAWWQAFGAGRGRLTLMWVRRGDRLVGVAPMMERGRLLASPTNYHSPGYGFVALDQAAAAELATAALQRSRATTWSFLDQGDPTQQALLGAASRRRLSVTRILEHPPYVNTVGAWADYEARQDAKLLRDLRRRERRLAEEGTLDLSIETGPEDLEANLEDCFRTEAASWKGAQGTAMASQPATRRFYSEIARFTHSRGELMLAFLRLDGQPIATQLNLCSGNTVTVLKLGHDEAYSRFAPGKLLVRHVLQHCFAAPTTCYDFSGHSNAYKMEWADDTRPLLETRTYSAAPADVAAWASFRFGRPLAKRVLGR